MKNKYIRLKLVSAKFEVQNAEGTLIEASAEEICGIITVITPVQRKAAENALRLAKRAVREAHKAAPANEVCSGCGEKPHPGMPCNTF